jgi:thymidylate kinase
MGVKLMDRPDIFKAAAYLANPYSTITPSIERELFEGIDTDTLFQVLRRNKVLFRTLDQSMSSNSPSSKSNIVRELIASNSFNGSIEKLRFLKSRILETAESFENYQVQFIFLKSLTKLPLDSDNFDILVHDEDLPLACDLLQRMGFVEVTWTKEPYKRLFRKIKGAEDCIAFHLHTKMAWDGIEFVNLSNLWNQCDARKIERVTIRFPSPENHMLITLAHAFFENHSFKLSDLINIAEDAHERKIDWDYIEQWVATDNWRVPFWALLQFQNHLNESIFLEKVFDEKCFVFNSKKTEGAKRRIVQKLVAEFDEKRSLPISIPIFTASKYYVSKIVRSRKLSPYGKLRTIASLSAQYIGRRMFGERQPAFVISISGEDGTGKTTQAKYLWKELNSRDIKTSYVWSRGFGLFFEPLLHLVRKPFLGEFEPTASKNYEQKRSQILEIRPVRLIWAYMIILDHLLQISSRVALELLSGNVVICDRYIYDTFVDSSFDLGIEASLPVEEVMEKMVPSTAVTFLMAKESDEIQEKDFSTNLHLPKKKDAYCKSFSNKNALLIDVSKPLKENRLQILSIVLKEYN